MSDIFRGVGIEIQLNDEETFLKVKETLTRIGVPSKHDKRLYQSCHILHKQGRYVILHFKELFLLDNKPASLTEDDLNRRNTIVKYLQDWKLVKIVDQEAFDRLNIALPHMIKILPYKDKGDWELISKYNIGKKIEQVDKNEKVS